MGVLSGSPRAHLLGPPGKSEPLPGVAPWLDWWPNLCPQSEPRRRGKWEETGGNKQLSVDLTHPNNLLREVYSGGMRPGPMPQPT